MAIKLALDTSAYSEFNRGNESLREFFKTENDLVLPLIVIGELRAGFSIGTKPKTNERLLRTFLDSPNVDTITLSDSTTKEFAQIFASLRKAGKPIGTNDMWIAALCIEHNLPLLTLDKDFSHIEKLKKVNI